MKKSILIKSLLAAVSLPFLAGCAEREAYSNTMSSPEAPPPTEAEVIPPQPNATLIWIPGEWRWDGRWIWVHGHWAAPPSPAAVWVKGHWAPLHDHPGYVWVDGHWK